MVERDWEREARRATAEQVVEAMDLVARFEAAIDRQDCEAFVSFFAPGGCVTGLRAATYARLRDVIASDRRGPALAHLTADHVVTDRGPGQLEVCYLLVAFGLSGELPAWIRINRITDDLVMTDVGWRIERHHVGRADLTAGESRTDSS